MQCAICGKVKTGDELLVFSYGAYTQILSILGRTTHEIENKDLPVHVCRECLQDSYEYSNK